VAHRERFTPGERDRPRYPSNRKLRGPQNRTGRFGEDKSVIRSGIEHNQVRCTNSFVYKLNVKTVKSKTELHYVYTSQGYAVVQLVEGLRYKPESHGFHSRWCH